MRATVSVLVFAGLCAGSMGFLRAQQVLNAKVSVRIDPAVVSVINRSVADDMGRMMTQLWNNTPWTKDEFAQGEQIACHLTLTIKEVPNAGSYRATAQIIGVRPVHNSEYQTVVFNYTDENWRFEYQVGQPLQYTPYAPLTKLTALLAYYAYMVVGADYDTFADKGGTDYFEAAREVVNLAQGMGGDEWTPTGPLRSRYWLLDNYLDPQLQTFRSIAYAYHRKGLDLFYSDAEKAQLTILEQLELLKKDVIDKRPLSVAVPTWIDAKHNELVQLFTEGEQNTRQRAYNILSAIDPTRTQKYQRILETN